MDLLALMHTHPARTTIGHRLFRFYESCAASGLPELERLAGTVNTWWPEIEVWYQDLLLEGTP
jgi:transposase